LKFSPRNTQGRNFATVSTKKWEQKTQKLIPGFESMATDIRHSLSRRTAIKDALKRIRTPRDILRYATTAFSKNNIHFGRN
jgi:hypothetical protein